MFAWPFKPKLGPILLDLLFFYSLCLLPFTPVSTFSSRLSINVPLVLLRCFSWPYKPLNGKTKYSFLPLKKKASIVNLLSLCSLDCGWAAWSRFILESCFHFSQSHGKDDPMNRSMPGLSVHHQLPEFTQTHVYRVGDAIQPSHPLSSPSPPAPNPSQHQSLFQWVNSSNEVAKSIGVSASASVLPMNTQDWSPLRWTGWSPCSPRDSQESSPTYFTIKIQSLVASYWHTFSYIAQMPWHRVLVT